MQAARIRSPIVPGPAAFVTLTIDVPDDFRPSCGGHVGTTPPKRDEVVSPARGAAESRALEQPGAVPSLVRDSRGRQVGSPNEGGRKQGEARSPKIPEAQRSALTRACEPEKQGGDGQETRGRQERQSDTRQGVMAAAAMSAAWAVSRVFKLPATAGVQAEQADSSRSTTTAGSIRELGRDTVAELHRLRECLMRSDDADLRGPAASHEDRVRKRSRESCLSARPDRRMLCEGAPRHRY